MQAEPENTPLPVRHIGRALRSIGRTPRPPRIGPAPEWWVAWADAEDALMTASNRLIDALEAMPQEQNRG